MPELKNTILFIIFDALLIPLELLTTVVLITSLTLSIAQPLPVLLLLALSPPMLVVPLKTFTKVEKI